MVVAEKCCQDYQDKTKTFLKYQGGGVLLFFQCHRHSLKAPSALPGVQTKANTSKFREGISSSISRLNQVLN